MSKVHVHFIGNVGKEPEVRTVGEVKVAKFNVAVTSRYKNKSGDYEDKTKWMPVEVWRGLAEVAEKYIKKGTKVFIAGTLEDNTYEKDGQPKTVEFVLAQEVEILTKADDKERTSTTTGATDTSNPPAETDDLPF